MDDVTSISSTKTFLSYSGRARSFLDHSIVVAQNTIVLDVHLFAAVRNYSTCIELREREIRGQGCRVAYRPAWCSQFRDEQHHCEVPLQYTAILHPFLFRPLQGVNQGIQRWDGRWNRPTAGRSYRQLEFRTCRAWNICLVLSFTYYCSSTNLYFFAIITNDSTFFENIGSFSDLCSRVNLDSPSIVIGTHEWYPATMHDVSTSALIDMNVNYIDVCPTNIQNPIVLWTDDLRKMSTSSYSHVGAEEAYDRVGRNILASIKNPLSWAPWSEPFVFVESSFRFVQPVLERPSIGLFL